MLSSMDFTLATTIVALAIFAAAAPQPPGQRISTVAIPITKRSGLVNDDKTVNFHALNSHVASVNAKILRGFDNYEKNTGMKHPSAIKGIGKRADSVALTKDNSGHWYGTISVGTPAQPFTVAFDTGGCDFFLPASTCSTCNGHTLWLPTSSSSSENLDETFFLEYGDGSTVSGDLYVDAVSVSGFTAMNQVIGVATTYSFHLQPSTFAADGLMGLAFESLSAYDAIPVFQTLIAEGEVTDPVFSFKLSSPGAELYIGGLNSALYTGSFTYVPVTVQAHWQVNMDNIQGNGLTLVSNVAAIIDTGASLIFGPTSEVIMLYNALGGTPAPPSAGPSRYTFPCSSFPAISLSFGGTSFQIPASALNIGLVSSGSSDCLSGIVASDDAFWTVGNVFLQNVYTTFDFGNLQVGFAQLA